MGVGSIVGAGGGEDVAVGERVFAARSVCWVATCGESGATGLQAAAIIAMHRAVINIFSLMNADFIKTSTGLGE